MTTEVFGLLIEMPKAPEESWWVKNAALNLVGRAPADMVSRHVDLLISYLKHEEWWLQNSALAALAPVVADQRCYQKVVPAIGQFLRTCQLWNATAPVRWGALPTNLRNASPEVQRLADAAVCDETTDEVEISKDNAKGITVMNEKSLFAVVSLLAALMGVVNASAAENINTNPKHETSDAKKSVKELQEDFRKLKFGMFIHYNMATYKGVQWVEGYPDPSTFNPGVDTIDTDAWADAAVSAGMTYGVLTVKHVGGFCLWDSKHTTYDVMHPDCPYKKDLVAQFIKSFKSRGLKVGLYYCWRHPGFGDPQKYKVLPPECDPATHTLKEQNEFQKAQIAELIEEYPDVFYIWNDALDPKIMPADEILSHIRGIRPDILSSSNWWDWGRKGTPFVDIAVKELRHFPEDNQAPGETCWKLEQKWFWNEGFRAGNAKGVMGHMATAQARNSNFLLNVGPDRNGKIIESSIRTLAEIGTLWKPRECFHRKWDSSVYPIGNGRLSIDLGNTPPEVAELPTAKRVEAHRGASNHGLETLRYQYARYLMISNSPPGEGSIPANLQGLWLINNYPAWRCQNLWDYYAFTQDKEHL